MSNLIEIALNMYLALVSVDILTILILPIQDPAVEFPLCSVVTNPNGFHEDTG